jgi:hypothetical protein
VILNPGQVKHRDIEPWSGDIMILNPGQVKHRDIEPWSGETS